jgi:hypothetical protein
VFRRADPAYDATRALDTLRATEYARLNRQGLVYLSIRRAGARLYVVPARNFSFVIRPERDPYQRGVAIRSAATVRHSPG